MTQETQLPTALPLLPTALPLLPAALPLHDAASARALALSWIPETGAEQGHYYRTTDRAVIAALLMVHSEAELQAFTRHSQSHAEHQQHAAALKTTLQETVEPALLDVAAPVLYLSDRHLAQVFELLPRLIGPALNNPTLNNPALTSIDMNG